MIEILKFIQTFQPSHDQLQQPGLTLPCLLRSITEPNVGREDNGLGGDVAPGKLHRFEIEPSTWNKQFTQLRH